ncbi:hypothetical protein FRB90_012739 [Tulasnella sp. 427]|nr:hypothetical protein FRB90_012739 [Tulasnella sp. 427]
MEIVLDIFFITVGGWDDWDVYSVLRMMTVCKTWRDLIKQEPSLWCQISSYRWQWHNELVLKHNQSGPLGVSSTSKGWLQSHTKISKSSRWRTIRYKGPLFFELTEALWSASCLRDLIITADSGRNGDGLPQVTIPNPINLLTLDLECAIFPWPHFKGSDLRSLLSKASVDRALLPTICFPFCQPPPIYVDSFYIS